MAASEVAADPPQQDVVPHPAGVHPAGVPVRHEVPGAAGPVAGGVARGDLRRGRRVCGGRLVEGVRQRGAAGPALPDPPCRPCRLRAAAAVREGRGAVPEALGAGGVCEPHGVRRLLDELHLPRPREQVLQPGRHVCARGLDGPCPSLRGPPRRLLLDGTQRDEVRRLQRQPALGHRLCPPGLPCRRRRRRRRLPCDGRRRPAVHRVCAGVGDAAVRAQVQPGGPVRRVELLDGGAGVAGVGLHGGGPALRHPLRGAAGGADQGRRRPAAAAEERGRPRRRRGVVFVRGTPVARVAGAAEPSRRVLADHGRVQLHRVFVGVSADARRLQTLEVLGRGRLRHPRRRRGAVRRPAHQAGAVRARRVVRQLGRLLHLRHHVRARGPRRLRRAPHLRGRPPRGRLPCGQAAGGRRVVRARDVVCHADVHRSGRRGFSACADLVGPPRPAGRRSGCGEHAARAPSCDGEGCDVPRGGTARRDVEAVLHQRRVQRHVRHPLPPVPDHVPLLGAGEVQAVPCRQGCGRSLASTTATRRSCSCLFLCCFCYLPWLIVFPPSFPISLFLSPFSFASLLLQLALALQQNSDIEERKKKKKKTTTQKTTNHTSTTKYPHATPS
eukprot:Rhum_TRINITY_DN14511_c20_g1::Rhum_TRINITY_DN14511_c20_g1_i1::g.93864::m.93864